MEQMIRQALTMHFDEHIRFYYFYKELMSFIQDQEKALPVDNPFIHDLD